MYILLYVRIPKGERTRNRPWLKGRFALATRIECTGLPSFSSRTTMRHKGGRVCAHGSPTMPAQVSPFHGESSSCPVSRLFTIFPLRHQRPTDTHFADVR